MTATDKPRHRILLVHDGHGPLRGSEHVISQLFDNIDATRFCWVVLTNHKEFAGLARSRGIPTEEHPFRMLFVDGLSLRDLRDFVRFARLAVRIMRAYAISLVHVNNGGSCAWVMPAALRCRLPVIVHLHSMWSARMQFILGMHHADRIVGVSQISLRHFASDPVASRRTRVIYNGVQRSSAAVRDRAAAKRELGLPSDSVIIGVIGALLRDKHVDIAIEALRLLPADLPRQPAFLVVGSGPELETLKAQASGLLVFFIGQRDDVPDLLRNVIDIVALPSATESLNLVLLEAAAAGVPRVASNVGGVPESIIDGVGGLLVPPGDAAALSNAIASLIRDPEKARRLGTAGQTRILREFSFERFVTSFDSLYNEMLKIELPSVGGRLIQVLRSVSFQLGSRVRTRLMGDRGRGIGIVAMAASFVAGRECI
jgi:glycosyltransferase involved in cell wall biosynthesis